MIDPNDVPVVTFESVGAFAATTIAGSPGWLREKRVGVEETAAGVSQTSTADLDVDGSTRYRYLIPSGTGFAANAGQYVRSDMKPGGAPQNANWLFSPSFRTDSPTVQLRFNAAVTNGVIGRIFVNREPISDQATLIVSPPNAGGGGAVTLTFPDSRERVITIYGFNQGEGRFGGAAIEAGYTLTKTAERGRLVAILGDSFVNGASSPPNGARSTETFAWDMATALGADTILQAGIGGTGFITALSGEPTSVFSGRVADIVSFAPDVVIIAGGRNDGSSDVQAELEGILDSFSNVPEIYVLPTATDSATTVRDSMQAACVAKGVPYLDIAIDDIPKGSDGIHPTFEGHRLLATRALAEIPSEPSGWTLIEWDGAVETGLTAVEWDGATERILSIEELS